MNNLRSLSALAALAFTFTAAGAQAQTAPLLPGDLAVSVYGNAGTGDSETTYTDGVKTPITLQEFAPTIAPGVDNTTPLFNETLPTFSGGLPSGYFPNGNSANVGIVGDYGAAFEGTLQLSGDGQSLSIAGYDGYWADNGALNSPSHVYGESGQPPEAQSSSAFVPRVAAIVNIATGAVDTSTVLDDIYNTNSPSSAFTANGTSVYLTGQGNATNPGRTYLATTGDNHLTGGVAPTAIDNAAATRVVTQAYVNANGTASSTANTFVAIDQSANGTHTAGIYMYPGSPTTSSGLSTPVQLTLSGSSQANFSPDGFFFANATTLYVADTGRPSTGGLGDGGLQKWTYSTTTSAWVLDYTLTSSTFVTGIRAPNATHGETGLASLTGEVLPDGTVELFGTSFTAGDADPDGLYGVVDTLSSTTAAPGETLTELTASAPDSDFKGVAFIPAAVPEPSSWALAALALAGFVWLRRRVASVRP